MYLGREVGVGTNCIRWDGVIAHCYSPAIHSSPPYRVNGYTTPASACRTQGRESELGLTTPRVVSYYTEPLDILNETISTVLANLPPDANKRVILYWKGDQAPGEVLALNEMADEVVQLPNVGREGETYLVSWWRRVAVCLAWEWLL